MALPGAFAASPRTTRVVLVDSGGSNLSSVQAAFTRLGIKAPVVSDCEEIRSATHVILPGVGAALPAMRKLQAHGLVEVIRALKQPVLGVCVGMQLLFDRSEEGDVACLGVIPGTVRKLPASPGIRIPHMGWNQLHASGSASQLIQGLDGKHAYFVHSFAVLEHQHALMQTDHGGRFTAVAGRENFYGAQFHPERSEQTGHQLLKNFLELA